MTHLPIWYLGDMPIEVCDKAFSEFMLIPPKDALMGKNSEMQNHLYRNTSIRFSTHEHWFGKKMYEFGKLANTECKWDYDISEHEAVQFAEYGIGQHYNWHTDNFPLHGGPTDRKITVIVLMNDPLDFNGGDFQIRLYKEYNAPLKKGSIIAFPSILEHKVIPVTSGFRYSATMWINGAKFR